MAVDAVEGSGWLERIYAGEHPVVDFPPDGHVLLGHLEQMEGGEYSAHDLAILAHNAVELEVGREVLV